MKEPSVNGAEDRRGELLHLVAPELRLAPGGVPVLGGHGVEVVLPKPELSAKRRETLVALLTLRHGAGLAPLLGLLHLIHAAQGGVERRVAHSARQVEAPVEELLVRRAQPQRQSHDEGGSGGLGHWIGELNDR